MNQDGQGDEKLQGPITRARAKRIKENDDQIAHGFMIAIEETMKEGLKIKNGGLEDDGIFLTSIDGRPCTYRPYVGFCQKLGLLAYRSPPEETKEMRRQMEELLSKGYVRESLDLVPFLFC
ncbi:hypothetical protein M9H77_06960 [Catharanthus roseus]|uniref:Uncharacterized protein n=1 Tax=Catharanthus roseus TaxID=4058 RepID=A0ACC0BTI7_CATRO|nr:hypothetical protein M9H77_06960 [Catharanthus roseus]